LFDLQKGYCDYYATAMVVLARAGGLPARMVKGYASGTYDADNARYVVTAADAHSWVEVYFPGYGWVEFEPTGGRPAVERPAEINRGGTTELETALEPIIGGRAWPGWPVVLGLVGGLALLGLAGGAWWAFDGWRLRRMSPTSTTAALYQRLQRQGRRIAVPPGVGDTPYEYAAGLAQRLADLAHGRRWAAAVASTDHELGWLIDLYVRGLYSPRDPDSAEQAQAIRAWRRLRWRLRLAWLWHKQGGIRRDA